MRPQDIEQIANRVIGALGTPVQASAGCSGVSDPQPYTCGELRFVDNSYGCECTYECGGAGSFDCVEYFVCNDTFTCETNYTVPI